jgi:hypothetical protein
VPWSLRALVLQDFVARRGWVSEIMCVGVFSPVASPLTVLLFQMGPLGSQAVALHFWGVALWLSCRMSGVGGQAW